MDKTEKIKSLEFKSSVKGIKGCCHINALKRAMVDKAMSWPGEMEDGKYIYHYMWKSRNGKWAVALGKFGKEYYCNQIRYADGHKGNNPNDMKPVVFKDGQILDFCPTFEDIFDYFEDVANRYHFKGLELLGDIMVRQAYKQDHYLDESGEFLYIPPQAAVSRLKKLLRTCMGIDPEAFIQFINALALNEDVKEVTIGNVNLNNYGSKNTLLTFANEIGHLLGRVKLCDFCGGFTKRPIGMSPIPAYKIADVFPHLNFQYERKKQKNANKLEIIKTSDSNIEQPAEITH